VRRAAESVWNQRGFVFVQRTRKQARRSITHPSQFLTPSQSPANCGPVQRAVREARVALQLQIMAPSWRLSHSALAWQLCDFCISLQSPDPMQAHLRPSGVSKQSNVAQAIEQASNNAATTPNMRRADRISPPMSRGGILPLDMRPRYENSRSLLLCSKAGRK
jgi:hypothetical protein